MSRGTRVRTVRIEDRLWLSALGKATNRGETVSDVIRRALEAYLDDPGPDLRACCDHPPHEPGRCEYFTAPQTDFPGSIRRCDCDGWSPSASL